MLDSRPDATPAPPVVFGFSRGDLLSNGWTRNGIAAAVRGGVLHRSRNGVYLAPEDDVRVKDAARHGGLLTCVSELDRRGVFVLQRSHAHVYLAGNASRQRPVTGVARRHWGPLLCDSEAHHGGWDARRRDLRRDQAAAALGFCTYRPIAEDIFWNPDRVLAAVRGLLASARGTQALRRTGAPTPARRAASA